MPSGLRALYHGSAIYHLSLTGRAPRELALKLDPWPGDPVRGEALLAGEFRFESEAVRAPSPPWRAGTSEEWAADLHRFHWLADLAALGSDAAWDAARLWTRDWIEHFDVYDRIAWRADVMGDRLFAWLEYFDRLASDGALRAAMLRSLARQSRHLARVAHREAPGLPRLAALRGLVAALAAQVLDRALGRSLRRCATSSMRAHRSPPRITRFTAPSSRRSTAPRRCCASSAMATASSPCSTAPTKATARPSIASSIAPMPKAARRRPRRIAAMSGCAPGIRWCCSIAASRRPPGSIRIITPARSLSR